MLTSDKAASVHISDQAYVICSPEQPRASYFAKELGSDKFIEAFVNFSFDHWQNNDLAPFIRNRTILLNFKICYSYSVI